MTKSVCKVASRGVHSCCAFTSSRWYDALKSSYGSVSDQDRK